LLTASNSLNRKEGLMATTKFDARGEPHTEVTQTEARQGTGPRAMFWVLTVSLTLAVIAGLALGFGWIAFPSFGTP
jgi:hypothetical protein